MNHAHLQVASIVNASSRAEALMELAAAIPSTDGASAWLLAEATAATDLVAYDDARASLLFRLAGLTADDGAANRLARRALRDGRLNRAIAWFADHDTSVLEEMAKEVVRLSGTARPHW